MKKEIKKSDIYGGSTYPDQKKHKQYLDQEEKKSNKQDKTPVKSGDTVKFTKPRKNEYGEWGVRVYVNGKVFRPAEIFADSKEDAIGQVNYAKEMYRKKGVEITESVNPLREMIIEMAGVLEEAKDDYTIYHSSYSDAVAEAKASCEKRGFYWNNNESFNKIGSGSKRPKEGETTRVTLQLYTKDGEPAGRAVHFQVYGMGKRYELNMYISPLNKKKYEEYDRN